MTTEVEAFVAEFKALCLSHKLCVQWDADYEKWYVYDLVDEHLATFVDNTLATFQEREAAAIRVEAQRIRANRARLVAKCIAEGIDPEVLP